MSSNAIYYAELTQNQKVQKLAETDLSQKSCRARSGDLRCTLDAHHRNLGSAHIAMGDSGALISWKDTE